ncbi:MAG: ribonuclease HII [Acidobacteriaceae bacterium]
MAPMLPTPQVDRARKSANRQQRLRQLVCSDAHEQALRSQGFRVIAGVDEVGRGALFGPVVAAAVILPPQPDDLRSMGLTDSKQLSRKQREELDARIRAVALDLSIAEVDAQTIDSLNIYQASRLAMLRAVQQLTLAPDHLLIDALRLDLSQLTHPCAQTSLNYGDALSLSIAAASVVAKVHRDALMRTLDLLHPHYGLAAHKGYATSAHRKALLQYGPTPLHRNSFAPVLAVSTRTQLAATVSSGRLFAEPADEPSSTPPRNSNAHGSTANHKPTKANGPTIVGEEEDISWD